ncbi:MAG: DUF4190 domain-containing protein [Clostridia bacterium]|nr:DUF4190 domain-containing protein [Clostridia bacterium]
MGFAITSLILGILAILGCNCLYLIPLAAIVFGIIALCSKQPKGMAISGIVLGGVALIVWPILDTILAFFTMGASYLI